MPAKLEKRKRREPATGSVDPRARPVPESDDEDEDSPSKRPLLSDDRPLTAREIRELLGHVTDMRTAWDSFRGRLDSVEKEQSKTGFEVANLQSRTRVLEKDQGQQKQTVLNQAKALEDLTSEVNNMKVKIDDLSSRSASSGGHGHPGPGAAPFVPSGGDPWGEYLRQRQAVQPTVAPKDTTRPPGGGLPDDKGDFLSEEDKKTLVWGGWLQDTKRSVIEEESGVILQMPEIQALVDTDKLQIFGPRRSVGLLRFKVREGESFQDTKGRMWEVIRALARIKHTLPSTSATGEDKTLWASFVKTKNARVRSAHVSMIRRVAISLAKDNQPANQGVNTLIGSYDCDWNLGTVWCGSEKLGSSTHRQPKDQDECVLLTGGWVNVSAVARIAGCSTDDSKSAFERKWGDFVQSVCNTQMGQNVFLEVGWNTHDSDEFHWALFIATPVSRRRFIKRLPKNLRDFAHDDTGISLPFVAPMLMKFLFGMFVRTACFGSALAVTILSPSFMACYNKEYSQSRLVLVIATSLHVCPTVIEPDRRHIIGSDHAIVIGDVLVAGGPVKSVWGNDSRARWVCRDLPDVEIVDEDDLIDLAKKCSKPRGSQQYRDSDEVKNAILAARVSGTPRDWKAVHKLRRSHQRSWMQSRLTKILNGDWDQYRQLQNERKRRRGWWGNMLAENSSVDLAESITEHLKSKMTSNTRTADEWEHELANIIHDAAEDDTFVPFTLLEVREELNGMKCRSAVGPDGIGVHLLRECADHENIGPRLLSLINHIVATREMPASWERSFLALLAKCRLPSQPGDLRPICVSSAFHKLVNRLVCARALPLMRRGSKISCCGKGRQAADLIGSLSRLRDVTKEWCHPLILCKLDVAGAFDRVDRASVAELLRKRLRCKGVSFELRYLLAQLGVHEIVGNAPGGKQVLLRPDNGIKQGAPESAELFGLVVDTLLSDLVHCKQWGDLGSPIAELDIDLLFYQDDVFLVETQFGRLCKRIGVVDRCLRQAGLTLAKDKTKIVANEHYTGPRRAVVGADIYELAARGDSLKVLGVAFSLSRDASEQAKEIIGRTRDAAAAHKDILCAPGAWTHKVSIMRTLVESQFSWTAGALHWSKDDLHALNVLQQHTCRSAFGLKRVASENWVQWNQRTMRFVRVWLLNNHVPRWSERILTLQHTLHGHWARRTEVVRGVPRACAPMRALLWRNTHWWRAQQDLSPSVSMRHPCQFYASYPECQLSQSCGNLWYVAAQDRANWSHARRKYLEEWDVRWASGRQLTIRC
ncbi:unnamed protein product [Symbiodinium sp. CCMP2592]|nr:unnamed protein product [Symbiodinium sp. CCMP2592]